MRQKLKTKLLIVELWGLGDLMIATPFLRAAAERFDVTLLAKPFALDLRPHFWPAIEVVPFTAPWTAFRHKYHLWRWPWLEMARLQRRLSGKHFDIGLSARWGDPRDHFLLKLSGAKERLGFPRLGSQYFLTQALAQPDPQSHRYEYWRVMGQALKVELPPREKAAPAAPRAQATVLIHTGAAQRVRVWPLKSYQQLARRLRDQSIPVQIACDADQRAWWLAAGEKDVATPANASELIALTDRAGTFIGNDSGPGHLAALCGVPTFTIFGPQLPEWFIPLHAAAEGMEGKACPYKPCKDYCRYPAPFCLWNVSEEEVWARVKEFVAAHSPLAAAN